MAWLELDSSGNYHLSFRLGRRRFKRSLRTDNRRNAENLAARLEENLSLVERGRLEIPAGTDIPRFLLSDGKVAHKIEPKRELTLRALMEAFFAAMPAGSVEEITVYGMRTHERHLYRLLGEKFLIQNLMSANLQGYIERRSLERGLRGRMVTGTTIKKAIVTLRTAWNWAVKAGHLTGKFPGEGLKYPKAKEKPPFQTWAEIERQIERGGLSPAEEADLWDCLFLTLPEIATLLEHVRTAARQPFIFPMIAFAAHTGARRSEMIRCRISDIDLEAAMVVIQERKRDHTRTTTRRVPISPFLQTVLSNWLSQHPGGPYTFCQSLPGSCSPDQISIVSPISREECSEQSSRCWVYCLARAA